MASQTMLSSSSIRGSIPGASQFQLRQSSVYSLTLDEGQDHLDDAGISLSSMNMDDLLKNMWPMEGGGQSTAGLSDANAIAPAASSSPALQLQGSVTLPRTLSRKTVDEVWKDIQKNNSHNKRPQGQGTFGEMTLEDFLVKSGVAREDGTSSNAEPAILPIQIIRIGQFVILCVPGEFTTMSGRRLREAVKEVLVTYGKGVFSKDTYVVIAGLTNAYSQYVTTFEEYQIQRYEGTEVNAGPSPPDLLDKQISFLPPVVVDMTPVGVKFGDVKQDAPKNDSHTKGDTVEVTFWSACPRNDLMTEGTFSLVELLDSSGKWKPAYDDDDFCLRFKWSRPAAVSPYSHATIQWEIPLDAIPGVYRIRHFGAAKHFLGSVQHFTGTSNAFVVS